MAMKWPSVQAESAATDFGHTTLTRVLQAQTILLAALVVFECVILFAHIDNAYLSIGEGNNAKLGQNVLKYGYPRVWDGSYLVFPLYGGDVDENLAWVGHPWLQYYLAAGGVLIFGPTNLGARLMFCLCGVASVVFIYFLALRLSRNRILAGLSAIILALHPLFWFYSRQSRYYSPTILLMILAMLCYLKWAEDSSVSRLACFVLVSTLLFYSLYTVWAFVMLAVGAHYLLFVRSKRNFWQFAMAAIAIAALTLPFFAYAPPHFHLDRQPTSDGYTTRLLVHLWKIHSLYYPLLVLPLVVGIVAIVRRLSGRRAAAGLGISKDYLLFASVPCYICFIVIYPFFTTHYMLPVLPVGAIAVAWLVLKLREYSRWAAPVALALMLSTNVLHALPYIVVDKLGINPSKLEPGLANPTWTYTPGTPLSHYLTEQLAVRFYPFDFIGFLTHDFRHELEGVTDLIENSTSKSDVVYSPWNDADAIAFYTGRKVKYHSEPSLFPSATVRNLLARGDDADFIDPLSIDVPPHYYMSRKFYEDYDRIKVNFPKEYFETYPNMDFFDFRTNLDAPQWFYIFKRKTPREGPKYGQAR